MAIFQKSIINKYLKNLDNDKVNKAYEQYQKFFGDKLRLFDILHLKEENYQEGFLREIFVQVLGYTIRPDRNFNLTTEYKNQTDSKKADGAIIRSNSAIGVIELKSSKTFNLENIKNQAFNYKHNQPDCRYVITSNFHYLRLYIDNSTEFEEFDLFELKDNDFKLFYLILSQESIFNDIPLKMKDETKFHEESISEKFYKDYKQFRDKIFNNLIKNNPQYDKLTLFKKTQKLLDRFIFIWFAEDTGLVAPNMISNTIQKWKNLLQNDEYFSLFSRFQIAFQYLNAGYTFQSTVYPSFNGGLFQKDEIIDNPHLKIDDDVLQNDCLKISVYDFNTDLDVNILGHIFEHSLSEIEEIQRNLQGNENPESIKTSKRKKDGIFYTPKYITNYIVENTIGKVSKKKQEELEISDIEITEKYSKKGKLTKEGKVLFAKLQEYKNWLLTLKILDPACGSGAFLNSALDFLINEHKQIDDLISHLTGDKIRMFDTDKSILENNIFGVDINEESVEIAKLSLWLRTARKDRKLSDLNNNIKCGNSLIDNSEIAGDKAFNWNTEFSEIMKNGGFDVIIGNPPYVFAREKINQQEKDFYNSNFKSAEYQVNTYLLFIEKSVDLMKTNGYFGLIVPNAWLMVNSASKLRKYLLQTCAIDEIINLSGHSFETANVETIIILSEKKQTSNNQIKIFQNQGTDFNILHFTDQNTFLKNENFEFKVFLNSESSDLTEKLKQNSVILDNIVQIKAGLKAYETGKGNPLQSEDDVKNRPYDYLFKYDEDTYKYLNGKNVGRYFISWSGLYLRYGKHLAAPRTFDLFNGEKIIIREITSKYPNCIFATYTSDTYLYNMSNIGILPLKKDINLLYILAILNSRLMSYYFLKNTAKSVRKMFPKIILNDLRQFPFKEITLLEQKPFIEKVELMLNFNNQLLLEQSNLLNTLKEEKHLENINNKLELFNELTFEEFKTEIKKQKIQFKLGNENNQWREYFNTTVEKIHQLQRKIENIDNEINKMVYALYGLTKEEITIVEKAK